MTISGIMSTGLSALKANQSALTVTSSNVSNANTPGYARVEASFVSRSVAGQGFGVDLNTSRITNQFVTETYRRSISEASHHQTAYTYLDRAQSYLGDPSDGGSLFASLDNIYTDLASLAVDPSSSVRRGEVVDSLQNAYADISQAHDDLSRLRFEADSRISSTVTEANQIMSEIASLNIEIQRAQAGGLEANGALSQQSQLIDRLSEIMDVRVEPRSLGGYEIRSQKGFLLVDTQASSLQVTTSSTTDFGKLEILPANGQGAVDFSAQIQSGELRGLLDVRDRDLVETQLQLSEYASGLAYALNEAHNASSSVPAPTTVTGRNTGLIATDSLNFSGTTNIGVIGTDGRLIDNIVVDFDASTITVGGVPSAFTATVGGFATALDTALGANGSASFTNGQLSISATGMNGIAISDDPASPTDRAGTAFSHFFGLNDVVKSTQPTIYQTGISGTDAHGFTNGDTVQFDIRNPNGDIIRSVNYTVSGATIDDVITGLNATGVLSGYATASLTTDGELQITPVSNTSVGRVDVANDTTTRGTTGVSLSALFGVGSDARIARSGTTQVNSDILADNSRLATAQADLTGAVATDLILTSGDARGADLLTQSRNANINFAGHGNLTATQTSITDYAGKFASAAGQAASASQTRANSAEALKLEAEDRRTAEEGVNIDEEMVNMITYQQGYSAASRLITTAQEMYDILLQMV